MELEEAKKLLMEEEKKKQEVCIAEVDAVLKKHGYVLKIQSNFIIVPNPQGMANGECVSE